MSEITRAEAKRVIAEWTERHAFARNAFTGNEVLHDRYEAILRLALAALEDADTLHDMARRADQHVRDCGVVPGDSCGECAGFADELAGLIDRTRGVSDGA